MQSTEHKLPFVSVIIPTYHDWERLRLCLDSLNRQTYPKERYEIIVVNNDPEDVVPANFVVPNNFTILEESKPGSYAARNRAIQAAKGEIYAFTDSDCQPHKNWLEVAVKFLSENSEYERIGGDISLTINASKANWFEIYEIVLAFPQKEFVEKSGMAATANMISKKRVFDKVGLFDATLMSGGDGEWGRRAFKYGSKIKYLKDCRVYHPTRYRFSDIATKNRRLAGGQVLLAKKQGRFAVASLLLVGFLPPVIAIKRALKSVDQPLKNRVIAILVCWYIKLFSTAEILKLLVKGSGFERV